MAPRLPSSRGSFRFHLLPFDVLWAAAAPPLALYLRDANILSAQGAEMAMLYCSLSFLFAIIGFWAFRVSDAIPRHFSVHDAIEILKATIAAALATTVVLFSLTRLEGIPRSIPVLQALLLAAGLFAVRAVTMLLDKDGQVTEHPSHAEVEHIIMIGSTKLSSLYIQFLRAYSPLHRRVIAVLDAKQTLIGRAMSGVPVIAPPQHLAEIIEEFAVHGVYTDRIIIGGDEDFLSEEMLIHVRLICKQRQIALDFLPKLMGLGDLPPPRRNVASAPLPIQRPPTRALRPYFRIKRIIDCVAALIGIVTFLPLLLLVSVLIRLNLGSPILFWQKRIGQDGKAFFLYKFRTLPPPFDRHGQPVPNDRRISRTGRLLRESRLDEFPQLLNVLFGEMSLVGPRPLLPEDQPTNTSLRLMVRPGLTGWAQINGGNLVTPEEKGALDDWYVQKVSLWLDLRIALLTMRFLFTGERRSEQAVSEANSLQQTNAHLKTPASRIFGVREVSFQRNQTAAAMLRVNAQTGLSQPNAGTKSAKPLR
jgi:lipopolysaccharide/colanic/teichoic acid biosynthesis glycosyltransferase